MGTMVQRKFPFFLIPFFLIPFFICICVHFRDDEPVFLQQAHMLGGGIAGEMQDFRHVEHIISDSKAPFGWPALVSCRDLKSLTVPKRCRRISLAAARRIIPCSGS